MKFSRELIAASARPLLLAILFRGDSYGYAIIQDVKAHTEGQLEWTEGMLYPVLHRLEREGLVESYWDKSDAGRKRRYYRLKREGRRALDVEREQWSILQAALSSLWRPAHVRP
jgi:DNA-binding PadR family transcriptional regulator